jgi:hypothetical protein
VRGSRCLRLIAAIACVAAMFATSSSCAGAEAGSRMLFRTDASNGYSVIFSAEGATAFLRVGRRLQSHQRAGSASFYIARAKQSGTSVSATFGSLGAAALRFHPSGKVSQGRSRSGCRGPDHFTTRFGTFAGNLDFEGEGGYTDVHLKRAKGRMVSPLALDCGGLAFAASRSRSASRVGAQAENPKTTTLQAGWRLGLSSASFTAVVDRARGTRFFAGATQSEGALAIYRFAFALASPMTFAANNALSLAGVTPPPPFSGSATLERATNGAKSWTGSLAVSFPGAPEAPLTGPQFKVQLVRSW